jgi:Tfp pilus assembly protein PilF
MKKKAERKSSAQEHGRKAAPNAHWLSFANPYLLLALLTILTFIAYSNSFSTSWHYDDLGAILHNPDLRLTEWNWGQVEQALQDRSTGRRPLASLTFAVNYYFARYQLGAYHATNLAIHLANSWLVFLLLLRIVRFHPQEIPVPVGRLYAFAGASLWACSPLQTMAVTYLIQRMASLSALFFLLSFLGYLNFRDPGRKSQHHLWLAGCILGAALALASKENALVLPLIILLFEGILLHKEGFLRTLLYRLVPLAAVGILLGAIAAIQYRIGHVLVAWYQKYEFNMWERLLSEGRVMVHYLTLLLCPLPSRLALVHEVPKSTSLFSPLTTLLSWLIIFGLLGIAYGVRKKLPVVSFWIFWFFAAQVIESTILPLELMFEYRIYLPSVGLMGLVVYPLIQWPDYWLSQKRRKWSWCLILLLAGASSLLTLVRNRAWVDEITLWEDNVAKYPNAAIARNNLGSAYFEAGNYQLAELHLREAARLDPRTTLTKLNLAHLCLAQGRLNEAGLWNDSIDSEFNNAGTLYSRGLIYSRLRDWPKARLFFLRALQKGKFAPESFYNLATACRLSGRPAEARHWFQRFVEAWKGNPRDPHLLEARQFLASNP